MTTGHPTATFSSATATTATGIKWLIAAVASLYLSLPSTVQLLLLLMAADFITGIAVAYQEKKLDQRRAWKGFNIKFLTLMIVGLAHAVTEPFKFPMDMGAVVAGAYAITELFSIIENCARVGVPIPEVLIQAMLKVRPEQRSGEDVIKELERVTVTDATSTVHKDGQPDETTSSSTKTTSLQSEPVKAPPASDRQ